VDGRFVGWKTDRMEWNDRWRAMMWGFLKTYGRRRKLPQKTKKKFLKKRVFRRGGQEVANPKPI